jgi:muramidase (phage lysozyme)
MNAKLRAFLDMIAFSEGTSTIKDSDNGYNVVVGGTLFKGYADHPRIAVKLNKKGLVSTAAGRYQILSRYYDHYKKQLHLVDFGHDSQDKIAIQLINECHALDDIDQGRIREAIEKCRSRWASLPGAGYGQHEHSVDTLLAAYDKALEGVA